VHSYLFEIYCTSSFVSELASAVRKQDARIIWKFRRPVTRCTIVRAAWTMLWTAVLRVSNALAYACGLAFGLRGCRSWSSASRGLAESGSTPLSSAGQMLDESGCGLFVFGSMWMVGMAHIRSAMLIQKGNQRLWLMVEEANEGPMKATT
jgi:hypothetical protein